METTFVILLLLCIFSAVENLAIKEFGNLLSPATLSTNKINTTTLYLNGRLQSSGSNSKINFLGIDYDTSTWARLLLTLNDKFRNGKWQFRAIPFLDPNFANSTTMIGSKIYDNDIHRLYFPWPNFPCFFEHPSILLYGKGHCSYASGNRAHYYHWTPNKSPESLNWNPLQMCKVLNGRNVLFVGDSMQSQFFFSYISAHFGYGIHGTKSSPESVESLEANLNGKCYSLCPFDSRNYKDGCVMPVEINCGPELPSYSVSFVRSNEFSDFNWIGRIKTVNASVIFMNTGAHPRPDEELLTQLNNTFAYLFANFPGISVVYRNTPYGHPNCKIHTLPLNESEKKNISWNGIPTSFKWDHFDEINDKVSDLISKKFSQILYIDIAHSTNYRADAHSFENENHSPDCLHYCIPGPTFEWVGFHTYALSLAANVNIIDYGKETRVYAKRLDWHFDNISSADIF